MGIAESMDCPYKNRGLESETNTGGEHDGVIIIGNFHYGSATSGPICVGVISALAVFVNVCGIDIPGLVAIAKTCGDVLCSFVKRVGGIGAGCEDFDITALGLFLDV